MALPAPAMSGAYWCPAPSRGAAHKEAVPVPMTSTANTHETPTPTISRGGKRIYIVKDQDHDQAVVRTVPVGVCAAPPRVNLHAGSNGSSGTDGAAPTCPIPTSAATSSEAVIERHGLAERMQRV